MYGDGGDVVSVGESWRFGNLVDVFLALLHQSIPTPTQPLPRPHLPAINDRNIYLLWIRQDLIVPNDRQFTHTRLRIV